MRKSLIGYTVVELLIVIVVIGILVTLSTFRFSSLQAEARDSQRSSKTTVLAEALEKYFDNNGEYPGCLAISGAANTVTTTVLPNVSLSTLLTPRSASGDTNSIKCTDLTGAPGEGDVFAYVGDNSAACTTGQACVGFTLKYKEESTGIIKAIQSRRKASTTVILNPIATIFDDFNRTGSTLGTTSTGGVAWSELTGTWSTNGTNPTTSNAASTSPVATVDSRSGDADASVTVAPGDALYFRVKDANNWWRLREQTNAHPYTYYTSDPYTYYTYSYSPNAWTLYDVWCEDGHAGYPPTGTYYSGASPSNGYYDTIKSIHMGTGSGGCRYYWGKSGTPIANGNSTNSYGLGFSIQDYTRSINTIATANTGYTSVAHTGYTSTPHTGYTSVAHTGYTSYYGLVLEKSDSGSISQVWAQPDTTTRPTLARVVASGSNIAIYGTTSGSPLNSVTDVFGSSFTKYGIGRVLNDANASAIDDFSVIKP